MESTLAFLAAEERIFVIEPLIKWHTVDWAFDEFRHSNNATLSVMMTHLHVTFYF